MYDDGPVLVREGKLEDGQDFGPAWSLAGGELKPADGDAELVPELTE